MNRFSRAKVVWAQCILWAAIGCAPQTANAAFYTEGGDEWAYRAPIKISDTAAAGSTILLNPDFEALIGQTTAAGTFDLNSVRVVKNDIDLIGDQEFNDSVFEGALDPIGNSRGEIRFILEDAPGAADYFLYFDVSENGSKPGNPAQPINGTFEQSTGSPVRWTTSSVNAGGAQNNESYQTAISSTFSVPAGCATGSATVDNSPSNDGINATGRGWHLLGYRNRCEDGSGNELLRLARDLRIPAGGAAGDLEFSFQVQAWDGISNANNYDWFVVSINGTPINHQTMGVVAGNPALALENQRFGRSAFGAGLVDHGWRNASVDLSAFAGTTISFRVEARFSAADNNYRSWIKLDDITWSASTGTVGTPELASTSVASFAVDHDSSAIYCLGEPVTITAVDASGVRIPDFEGLITLDTQQNSGQFSLVSGNGSFAGTNTGTASYGFVASDLGQAAFVLNYPTGPSSIDIDAFLDSDSTIRDNDSEGNLVFSPSGFTITAAPLANPPSLPLDLTIPAQTAAVNFALHLTAYGQTADDPTCGVIETYAGNKSIAFWQTYENPATGTLQTSINSISIANSEAAASAQPISFASGQAQVTAEYPDVGALRISISDGAASGGAISGATGNFVVKPASLRISKIETTSGFANPAAIALTGTGFAAAGEPFVVEVDALNANNVLTPNFGRETPSEQIAVSSEALVLPTTGINGSTGDVINGTAFTSSASAGRQTNTNVQFDETGIISMRARLIDNSYLGAGDVSRPLVANVGRFYPARFQLTNDSVTASCMNYTYMDEPAIEIDFEVEAVNAGGAIVRNYSDALYGSAATANFQLTAENNNSGIDLSMRLSSLPINWINGTLATSSQIAFSRAALPDGPYMDLQLGARIIDSLDSKLIAGADLDASTSGNCSATSTCNSAQIGLSTGVVYGRLLVLPAQGPETSQLAIGLESQFFDGSEFQRSIADNCTPYSRTQTTLSNYTDNLQAGETNVISPGVVALLNGGAASSDPLTLSAPGAGNTGTVDVTFDVEDWLEYDWLGSGNQDPEATATFGGFRGHDRVIYWQELR